MCLLGRGDGVRVVGQHDPGVVEGDIKPPVGRLRGLHRRGDIGIIGHVGMDRGGLAPGRPDQLDGLVVGRNEVDCNDPGAFGGEAQRRGPSDSAGRTGDERHLAFESHTRSLQWRSLRPSLCLASSRTINWRPRQESNLPRTV